MTTNQNKPELLKVPGINTYVLLAVLAVSPEADTNPTGAATLLAVGAPATTAVQLLTVIRGLPDKPVALPVTLPVKVDAVELAKVVQDTVPPL